MNLCTMFKSEDVGMQVAVFEVLSNIVAEPNNYGAVVLLDLSIDLQVVRSPGDVLDSSDLANVMEAPWRVLLSIV